MSTPYIIYCSALLLTTLSLVFYPKPKKSVHKRLAASFAWAVASLCIVAILRPVGEVTWIDVGFVSVLCTLIVRHRGNVSRILGV